MRRTMIAGIFLVLAILISGCLGESSDEKEDIGEEYTTQELAAIPIALDEGMTGTISIPFLGVNFIDTDIKHHWNMPTNVSGVIVNVTWSGQGWDLELSTGTGDCPHSGMSMAESSGSSGELSVEYMASENETLEEVQWFAHIAVNDATSHRGQSLDYVFEVTLLTYDEEACEGDVCPV